YSKTATLECGQYLFHDCEKESVRSDVLRRRKSLTLATTKGRQCEHRKVFALDQSNRDCGLACSFPRDTRLGIHALSDVDKLDKVIAFLRLDRRRLGCFEQTGVSPKIGCTPGRSW